MAHKLSDTPLKQLIGEDWYRDFIEPELTPESDPAPLTPSIPAPPSSSPLSSPAPVTTPSPLSSPATVTTPSRLSSPAPASSLSSQLPLTTSSLTTSSLSSQTPVTTSSPALLSSPAPVTTSFPAPLSFSAPVTTPYAVGPPVPTHLSLTLDDAELEQFVDAQRNANTKRKTKSDLRKWYNWCNSVGEGRCIGDIPPLELDRLLGHFYCKVRKDNGELFEPCSLTSLQRSLDRHLTKELHKTFSIIRGVEFTSSNEKLKAARKMLKKEGKGNKPRAAEALDNDEVNILWETGALGDGSPEVLQNTIWYLLTLHLGMRGRDEHYKLRYGDLQQKTTTDGELYIEFSERDTKTRNGESTDTRSFKPKMWSTPHSVKRCPVQLFQKYIAKRPVEMCKPESPFYLAVNYSPADGHPWYKRQRMGKNKLGQIMKDMARQGNLKGKKTNHSVRKTMITTLAKNNVPETQIMQLSGHRNIQSLNSYKKATLQQQQEMSHLLSAGKREEHIDTTGNPITKNLPPSGNFFQGAQFSGCTLNIGFPLQQLDIASSESKRLRLDTEH